MKKFSLQWRITLMTALLIGLTCIAMNLMLCSSGVYYMDRIADALRGGGTVIITDEGTASFDPQFAEPGEELTIVVRHLHFKKVAHPVVHLFHVRGIVDFCLK